MTRSRYSCQWVLHYCLSCLHWKPRDARHYSSRQGAAFRGSHVILPEDGCLALCRSWAGQNRATETAPRIPQGSFMPGEIWALLQRRTHLYLLMPRRWRAVFVANRNKPASSALSKGWGLEQRSFNAQKTLSGDTELTAGAANVLNSQWLPVAFPPIISGVPRQTEIPGSSYYHWHISYSFKELIILCRYEYLHDLT